MQNGTGREVVIVEAARTPIGRGHEGGVGLALGGGGLGPLFQGLAV